MKNLKTKHNFITKVLTVLIAFAIAFTPIFDNVIPPQIIKAAGDAVATGAVCLTTNSDLYVEDGINYIKVLDEYLVVRNVYSCGDKTSLETSVNGAVESYTLETAEIKYMKVQDISAYNTYLSDINNLGMEDVTYAQEGEYILVYVKPLTVVNAEGESEPLNNFGYSLMAVYNVRNISEIINVGWYNAEGVIITSEFSSSAVLSTGVSSDNVIAGKIKYIVKKIGDEQPTDEEWNEAAQSPVSVAEDGRYVGYVGFFADDSFTVNQVSEVAIDSNAPKIETFNLQMKDSEGNWVDDTDMHYLDADSYDLSSYRYIAYVTDNAGSVNSGVYKATLFVDGVPYEMQYEAGYYICAVTDEIIGASELQIQAYDVVGNESEKVGIGNQIKLIDKDLRVNVEVWNGQEKVADTLEFPYDKVTKPYVIKYSITSGYEIDVKITIDGNEITKQQIGGTDGYSEGIYSYEFSYTLPQDITADAIIGSVKVDVVSGGYSDVKEFNTGFKYDVSAPVISRACLQYYDDVEAEWKRVTDGIDGNNVYYINPNTDEKLYRYYLKVKDTTDVVDYVKAYTDSACTVGEVDFSSIDGNEYVYPIDTSNIPTDGIKMYIKTADTLGNNNLTDENGYEILPSIKQADGSIKLELVSVKDEAGNKINLSQNKYYNKPIKVVLRASSGYRMANIYIGNTEFSRIFSDGDAGNVTADAITKRYQVECEFVIPAGSNQELSNMVAYAIDNGKDGVNDIQTSSAVSIGDLFYDATKPKATLTSDSDDWTNSPKVVYTISSGAASVESSISSASYSVIGSVEDSIGNELSINESGVSKGVLVNAIKESGDVSGTRIVFDATDMAGNRLSDNNSIVVKYDKTIPTIDYISVSDIDLNDNEPYLKGDVPISVSLSDNLTLESAIIWITDPSNNKYILYQTIYDEEGKNIAKNIDTSLRSYDGTTQLADGRYIIEVQAKDMAHNESNILTKSFVIDNNEPVVNVKVSSGVFGGKMPKKNYDNTDYDYFISSDVGVTFSCNEINVGSIEITDNGNAVSPQWKSGQNEGLREAFYTVNTDGRHTIKIKATDKSGNKAQEKVIEFVRDTQKPNVAVFINGYINYTENMGKQEFLSNPTLEFLVSDMTKDDNDLNVRISKNIPGNTNVLGQFIKTSTNIYTFSEEADYTVAVFSKDKANNQSDTRTVTFRLDKTAPELSINGIAAGGTSKDAATVVFKMREVFWQDAKGSVKIYRKAGDGHHEVLLKTIDYTPSSYETNVSEVLDETGVYRFEFSAYDKVGHTTSVSQTYTIDKDAPVVTLKGVSNYDITDKDVEFSAEIKEDFYNSKKIVITGTKTDISGYTSPIAFSGYDANAALSVIRELFTEDGIYDIQISCTDFVGNTSTSGVHFTIDKTKPVFGDLSKYDNAVLSSFEWDIDIDRLVSDLTVCDVHIYLNGQEYDGVSALDDGSYTLRITAEDEMGHYSERNVSFVIDTKAPVFIVTGVEDGEVRNEGYTIGISLQLDDDIMEFVELNGKNVIINNNEVKLNITDKGKYTIIMQAKDVAGNVTNDRIRFEYGQESRKQPDKTIVLVVAIALLAVLTIVLMRGRRNRR